MRALKTLLEPFIRPFVKRRVSFEEINMSSRSIAWSNNPPGLFLKSSNRFLIPLDFRVKKASLNSSKVFLEKLLILMYPMSSLIIKKVGILLSGILSRIKVLLKGSDVARDIVTSTSVPFGPFSFFKTSGIVI